MAKAREKRIDNDLQIHYTEIYRISNTSLTKIWYELRCSGRAMSVCYTSGICRVTPIKKFGDKS
jgi:hypothetical protein